MQCKSLTRKASRRCQRKILQTSSKRKSPLNDISHNAVMTIFFFRISRRLSCAQIESICVANPRVVLWMMTVFESYYLCSHVVLQIPIKAQQSNPNSFFMNPQKSQIPNLSHSLAILRKSIQCLIENCTARDICVKCYHLFIIYTNKYYFWCIYALQMLLSF